MAEETETPYKLPSDPGIKVYSNADGQIVICQESLFGDDDHFIYFSLDRADAIIKFIAAVRDELRAEQSAKPTTTTTDGPALHRG